MLFGKSHLRMGDEFLTRKNDLYSPDSRTSWFSHLNELWDTYTQILGTIFPIAVGIYTLRLSAFFAGGILHKPFQLMARAFFLYAFGSFVDLLALTELMPESYHFVHFFTYLIFFSIMTYSVYLLYRAWQKMGMGKV